MNLHRVTGKSDWELVSAAQRTSWQRLAAATDGIVTPGNIVTIVGIVIVIFGLVEIHQYHYWMSAVALAIGRLCDIADGLLAHATGTKSSLGELLDATFDKIGTFLTVAVFIYAAVASRWLLVSMVVPHIAIAVLVLLARQQKIHLQPSRAGKLSMAVAWVGLVGFVIVKALHQSDTSAFALGIDGLAILSIGMASYAAGGYLQEVYAKSAHP